MVLHLNKSGIRVLGISESFKRADRFSWLAGVVMRGDLRIDGVACCRITVGGDDSTDGVIDIYRTLDRSDINAILLNGNVISWFNIMNVALLSQELNKPIVSLTYDESNGLEPFLNQYFPNDPKKIDQYRALGPRSQVKLQTGYEVYLRANGISTEHALALLNKFTKDGRVPEPVRAARLSARAIAMAHQRKPADQDLD
jgi:endonuclease V-like protein UPF0215 family